MYRFTHGGAFRALSLALILPIVACGKKDAEDGAYTEPGASSSQPVATAPVNGGTLRVSSIELGKGLGSDMTLRDQTDDFGVRDTIYAVVRADGAATGAKLDAKWTYQSGQTVDQQSQPISPAGGETRHEFHLQKASAWPKGDYKVEIMLDGASAGTKEFSIK